ncbi:MAG: NAD-dependent epimerase/dehydratase family protein [Psychrobacillus sp.]
MKVLVTGANGFIGRNLVAHLEENQEIEVLTFTRNETMNDLKALVNQADKIVHLAGVNRPVNEKEFTEGNQELTSQLVEYALQSEQKPSIVLSSSIQADLDNAYGRSKYAAEKEVIQYSQDAKANSYIFRLPNVFGKWCRPNYNSAVATFCNNIANDLEINVHDPSIKVTLAYIDDVIEAIINVLFNDLEVKKPQAIFADVPFIYTKTLQEIVDLLQSFKAMRDNLQLPDYSDFFVKKLYTTYLSYLKESTFSYSLTKHEDNRGWLSELIKSPYMGQMFVSTTKPGITRGNHYHHTKVEKFIVIQGRGMIRFRHIERNDVLEYEVFGENVTVVDIPPGYTHSIENIGSTEMITLFWVNEQFDTQKPDTYMNEVMK